MDQQLALQVRQCQVRNKFINHQRFLAGPEVGYNRRARHPEENRAMARKSINQRTEKQLFRQSQMKKRLRSLSGQTGMTLPAYYSGK